MGELLNAAADAKHPLCIALTRRNRSAPFFASVPLGLCRLNPPVAPGLLASPASLRRRAPSAAPWLRCVPSLALLLNPFSLQTHSATCRAPSLPVFLSLSLARSLARSLALSLALSRSLSGLETGNNVPSVVAYVMQAVINSQKSSLQRRGIEL